MIVKFDRDPWPNLNAVLRVFGYWEFESCPHTFVSIGWCSLQLAMNFLGWVGYANPRKSSAIGLDRLNGHHWSLNSSLKRLRRSLKTPLPSSLLALRSTIGVLKTSPDKGFQSLRRIMTSRTCAAACVGGLGYFPLHWYRGREPTLHIFESLGIRSVCDRPQASGFSTSPQPSADEAAHSQTPRVVTSWSCTSSLVKGWWELPQTSGKGLKTGSKDSMRPSGKRIENRCLKIRCQSLIRSLNQINLIPSTVSLDFACAWASENHLKSQHLSDDPAWICLDDVPSCAPVVVETCCWNWLKLLFLFARIFTDFLRQALEAFHMWIRPLRSPRFPAGVACLFLWLAQSGAGLEVWQGRWQDLQNTTTYHWERSYLIFYNVEIRVISLPLLRAISLTLSFSLSLFLSISLSLLLYLPQM